MNKGLPKYKATISKQSLKYQFLILSISQRKSSSLDALFAASYNFNNSQFCDRSIRLIDLTSENQNC